MNEITVTRIPCPSEILKGEWGGMVYAIETECDLREEHNLSVEKAIVDIIEQHDDVCHYTVSLRLVKQELVYSDESMKRYCTLVQFRVRDSY